MTGVKAKSLREAKALDEDALGNYMKVLDGTKAITAAVVTKIFAKANGPASATVKKAKLTWMMGEIKDADVQTFEAAAVCRSMCSNPAACVHMLMHCIRMLMH